MTRPYYPLTPLPRQMMHLAEDALAAGINVRIAPFGTSEGRPRYYLHLALPGGSVTLVWVCGPDGVWSQRGSESLRAVRDRIAS